MVQATQSLPKFKMAKPNHLSTTVKRETVSVPVHDPAADNALVMPLLPKQKHTDQRQVVVDPLLSKNLRQHQRQGVSFLYECVMNIRGA